MEITKQEILNLVNKLNLTQKDRNILYDILINANSTGEVDLSKYYNKIETDNLLKKKQDTLSLENTKTINGITIFGKGNISIPKGADGKSVIAMALSVNAEGKVTGGLATLTGGETINITVTEEQA